MRTTVVTGLLGSGKTTFIRSFLSGRQEGAVVLVNDFGQAGIDGEIISAGGIETVELPSGCVCCTLKPDLINSIRKVMHRFSPGHLLIEPSGVASPAGVLEALESAGAAPASVVGIVDAVEFADLYRSGMYGSFLREQIELSDTILLNKVDLAAEDLVAAAGALITDINPRAVLFPTVNAVVDLPELPPRSLGERVGGDELHPLPAGERNEVRGYAHCFFETLSFKLPQGIPRSAVRSLFDGLASGRHGSIARAKALVQTREGPCRFDLAFGKIDVAPFGKEITDSRLVVIGETLDGEGIRKIALRL